MIRYEIPEGWIAYDLNAVSRALLEAKASILSLRTMPHQRAWVEALQKMELKREVAGTSRIEGADLTERELDAALKEETPEQQLTRSQKQAQAALRAYRWIAKVPEDRPVTSELICEIHVRIVVGADDDHCPPGKLRKQDDNVQFGRPTHRGCDGGERTERAFASLAHAIAHEYRDHDPLIQALAAHYHLAAMHPFLAGNGRSARALEALLLQRAGLKDTCFIAMSNYYYDEKNAFLEALASVRAKNHDLTDFLVFGLKGVRLQSQRLLSDIQHEMKKALYRNMMFDFFTRLRSPKRRVIAKRQLELLKLLLSEERLSLTLEQILQKTSTLYANLKNATRAQFRDLNALIHLKAISAEKAEPGGYNLTVRLEWPTEITETEFFQQIQKLPRGKTHSFLSWK